MPVFHTKTIESILEPVAQQVSRLVILHEEAEDGNAMPNLEQPVRVVSQAVSNLVKVGKETVNSSDDAILRQDMPTALVRVEKSSKLLEEASHMLKDDPYSGPARKRLIEGSGGILQATSALLLCFDESEVRKIVRECHRVLDYLAITEVIETMEELAQFLRDLSPCLAKVSRDVAAREKELTHQVHSEILVRCLDEVRNLAPFLICAMKVYIHIMGSGGGKGAEDVAENRNYLSCRMTEEINEIIRVLQLTSYDEEQSDLDNLTVLRKLQNSIQNKVNAANDWLMDPTAVRGGVGEKSLRQIIEAAEKVADRCLPQDAIPIRRLTGELTTMTDALCELRTSSRPTNIAQAESLARGIRDKLGQLQQAVLRAVVGVEKAGVQMQTAHTVQGRLEQARKWLSNPARDDGGLGRRAIGAVIEEGRKVADGLPGVHKTEILQLCDEGEDLSNHLAELCAQGRGDSPEAQQLARLLSQKLHELKGKLNSAVVNRVVEDFIDIVGPLRQFTEAVMVPEGAPNRDINFSDKTANLQQFSSRAVKTAKMVAASHKSGFLSGSGGNKKLAEHLQNVANQVESLTPQLISAGSIRMNYPNSKAADEHFENLRQQYADLLTKMRNLCDEATDSPDFIKASGEQMKKHTFLCEEAIKNQNAQKMVDNTSAIARLANRVLSVAKQESDNSEDPMFIGEINRASDNLQNSIPPMVQDAKQVAVNPTDMHAASRWRDSNKGLLNAVGQVRNALQPELPPLPDINTLNLELPPQSTFFADRVGEPLRNIPSPAGGETGALSPNVAHQHGRVSPLPKWARGDQNSDRLVQELIPYQTAIPTSSSKMSDMAPPRPPLPSVNNDGGVPLRPPPPETDDEDDVFRNAPNASQPIMVAAHSLHREVRQWSAKDNELIAAARKMALLMAHLSELVHNDDKGSKRELIATAKAIADASAEVTRIAKQLARECTDKRIRTNLLQVCERIPTIATQLKILSTVKATMLGAQAPKMV